jgi:hypothetical protein
MSKLMQQITVTRIAENGVVAFNTWVEKDPQLKVGKIVVFKDPALKEHEWTIHHIYDLEVEFDTIAKQRDFDNNNYDKHKGLGL